VDGRSITDLSVIEKSFVEEVRQNMKFSGISQAFYLENGAILALGFCSSRNYAVRRRFPLLRQTTIDRSL
jgi:hypothetical protein